LRNRATGAPVSVGLQKGRDKKFSDAIGKLASDLKALTAQPAAAAK
jgi:hypothetical protein